MLPERIVPAWKPADPERFRDFDEQQKLNIPPYIPKVSNIFLAMQMDRVSELNTKSKTREKPPVILPIWTSSVIVLSNSGTLGYILNVSLMQHSRYFKFGMSSWVQSLSELPNTFSSSSLTFSYSAQKTIYSKRRLRSLRKNIIY